MKKLLLSIVAVVAISSASFAQGRFSVGPELALPMGDFGDAVGLGIGASVRYEGAINDNLSWMGTVGFVSFTKKTVDIPFFGEIENSATNIPINAGVKYYFTESFNGFYAGAELGI